MIREILEEVVNEGEKVDTYYLTVDGWEDKYDEDEDSVDDLNDDFFTNGGWDIKQADPTFDEPSFRGDFSTQDPRSIEKITKVFKKLKWKYKASKTKEYSREPLKPGKGGQIMSQDKLNKVMKKMGFIK